MSKSLNEDQKNYITIEKELLAMVFAVDKFISYLVPSHIMVFTNHAAIRYLMSKPDVEPQLLWWILPLQEFDEIEDK